MRDRGYIYTLVTITLILILLSLLVFYFQVSKPSFSTTVTSIRTDELHYFIEAVKKDFARSPTVRLCDQHPSVQAPGRQPV